MAMPPATLVLMLSFASGCRVDEIETPSIKLGHVEVRGLSGGIADLLLEINVENKNDFAVTLVGISGGLELDGIEVGRVTWSGEHPCAKKKESTLHVPLRLSVGDHRGAFMALIDGSRAVHSALHGEATFARGVIRKTYPMAAKQGPEHEPAGRLQS